MSPDRTRVITEFIVRLDIKCYHTYYRVVASDLQAELKQQKPFRSLKEETNLSVLRTAAVLEHAFESALKPQGITSTQYNVLRILRGAEPGGLCRSEISQRLVRQVPDVTRLLDRLEDAKFIARQRGDDDRRYVVTRISRAGLNLLDEVQHQIDRIHDEQLGHLDDSQLRTLISLLEVVRRRA